MPVCFLSQEVTALRILSGKHRRSERGASITFALLLFLVCAVVGSVVLTAGTAASGRLSKLAEMDRRYYCVTSAASLLRECLDGQTVVVTKTAEQKNAVTVAYVNGVAGAPASTPVGDGSAQTECEASGECAELLRDAAEWLMVEQPQSRTRTFTLTHSAAGVDAEPLKAQITQTLSPDGTMELTVSNDGAEKYTLRMLLTLERTEKTERQEQKGSPRVTNTASGYTVTREVTTTVTDTTTFRWTLSEVRKGEGA